MGVQNRNGEAIFDKTIFGGYDVEQVDEFVQESRHMLLELKNEKEVLTQKLQILADKIDEYNQTKDQIESTLDNARISAADIIAVARHEAEQIRAAVIKHDVVEASDNCAQEAGYEYDRLDEIRRVKKEFCSSLIEQYRRQIDALEHEMSFEAERTLPEAADKKVFVVIKEQPAVDNTEAESKNNSERAISDASIRESSEKDQQIALKIASVISEVEIKNEIETDVPQEEQLIDEQHQIVNNFEAQKENTSEEKEVFQKEEGPLFPEEILTYEEYMAKILGTTSPSAQINVQPSNVQPSKEDAANRVVSPTEYKKKKTSFILKIKQMIDEIINEEEDEIDYEEKRTEREFEKDQNISKQ